jgi:hypothetical protein
MTEYDLKQSILPELEKLKLELQGNKKVTTTWIDLLQDKVISPLLVKGDGSCLFHATNAAHQGNKL